MALIARATAAEVNAASVDGLFQPHEAPPRRMALIDPPDALAARGGGGLERIALGLHHPDEER
jgi:hypothetical protein